MAADSHVQIEHLSHAQVLHLCSSDGTNRLTRSVVLELTQIVSKLRSAAAPLIFAGNPRFFSVGADLNEIAALSGPDAVQFSLIGQALMNEIGSFPARTIAVIEGHCMGGGLDLALACSRRVAGPHAMFGHRGAALGLMTGWGGTQRLPRLVGKGRALELFIAAEKVNATRAAEIGLVDGISADPMAEALRPIDAVLEHQAPL